MLFGLPKSISQIPSVLKLKAATIQEYILREWFPVINYKGPQIRKNLPKHFRKTIKHNFGYSLQASHIYSFGDFQQNWV